MYLLFIDACPRGRGVSRTLALSDHMLRAITAARGDLRIQTHTLAQMRLPPVDGALLQKREALIDRREWDDALFAPARAFMGADSILIAAPYWDLMFPAMLKIYIEHLFIRELTFCYRNDQPIGLCSPRRALYVTTAGSPVGLCDFGTAYLRAALSMLGVSRFDSVCAEGLDIQGANVQAILSNARAAGEAAIGTW